MKSILASVLLLTLLLLPAKASAEPVTDEKLIETFNLYMDSMREGDYDTMSQLMHPGEVEQFKELFLVIARQADADDEFGELRPLIGDIDSVEALEKTPAPIFFSKLMSSMVRFSPDLGKLLKTAEITLLGQVTEGEEGKDQLLHIVYRIEMELDGTPIRSVAVSSMKLDDNGRYGFLIDEQARGVITALEQRFGVE